MKTLSGVLLRFSPLRVCLFGALWICATDVPAAFARIEFHLHDAPLSDGKVEFKSGACDPVSSPPESNAQQTIQSETASYVVLVDPSQILRGGYGSFIYEFYVQQKSGQPATQWCRVRVQGIPLGTFMDQMSDVLFRVGESSNGEDGKIRIPLYNTANSKPILEAELPSSLARVSLSGESRIEINIANMLRDLSVGLYKDVEVEAGHPTLWQGLPQAALHLPRAGPTILQPAQKLKTGIILTVRPNRWHALGASIFPLAPDQRHEMITLNLNYDTPGGNPGILQIPVPIRFVPSFWSLLSAVLLGAIFGGLLAQLLPKSGPQSLKWYKAFLIAVVAGLLAEAIGIVLVFGKSEFRLLGFELDPYQLLPAAVIGALVGLYGFRKADDFLGLFRKP